jgi:hypothetical protein
VPEDPSRVTQHNAALVEQAAAAAKSLEEQAAVLLNAVAVFRLDHDRAAAGSEMASFESTRDNRLNV